MREGHPNPGCHGHVRVAMAKGPDLTRPLLAMALSVTTPALAQPTWTHLAATTQRTSTSVNPPPPLAAPTWIANTDTNNHPITFVGLSGVVADEANVYALGDSNEQEHIYAFDRTTGTCLWQASIAAPQLDSWSTPAIDADNHTVIVATGNTLAAFDATTGASAWTATLPAIVVNASPLVTTDLHPADRAFVTTFDGFGASARLVCVNVDDHDADANPFQPGEIVWTAPIGASSGNTPAYADATVYTATADTPGRVLAFDATAASPPTPLWATDNPDGHPFFAGVSVADGAVLAASYAFSGGQLNANLLKLHAATGAVIWSTPAGRTASTPIALADGRIVLSAGLPGFGSVPSVELFADEGDHATLLWDAALATWHDDDNDGAIDPGEHLAIGGWTHQPIVADAAGEPRLVVGAIGDDASPFDAYATLRVIDLARAPADDGFVLDAFAGCGSTPALAGDDLFSIGEAGLHAFLATTCTADCDSNGVLNVLDFVCFQQRFVAGDPAADCDDNGALNVLDFVCYQQAFVGGCP